MLFPHIARGAAGHAADLPQIRLQNLRKHTLNLPYFTTAFLSSLGLHFGAFWLPKYLQN